MTHYYSYSCDCEQCSTARRLDQEGLDLSRRLTSDTIGTPEYKAAYIEALQWLKANNRNSLIATYND